MAYTEVTVAAYNASPPPDDGTQVAANEVTWAGIKTKLADPIKTAFDTCQTNITAVVDDEIEVNDWAPAGTHRLFYDATPPANWTKSTTDNDKAIRIVSGLTGGTSGGTTSFSNVLKARTITQGNLPSYNLSFSLTVNSHSHTFSGTTSGHSNDHTHGFSGSTSTDGSHSHSYTKPNSPDSVSRGTSSQFSVVEGTSGDNTGSSGSHSHTFSGNTGGVSANHTHTYSGTTSASAPGVSGTISLGGSGSAMDFAIQYCDVIIAEKSA